MISHDLDTMMPCRRQPCAPKLPPARLLAVIAALFSVGFSGYPALLHAPATTPRSASLPAASLPAASLPAASLPAASLPAASLRGAALLTDGGFAPRSGPAGGSLKTIRHLAGPYAHLVVTAARKAHVSPRLVAAVVQVENGGNFHGSPTRVSAAGAIGVMQLEPNTAWDTLRVNPWNVRQNINGGARYLAMMLRRFGGNVRLALMAYNAGPTSIAQGGRPWAAVAYAQEVMRDARA
jgi:soluble lytic murein transglycosylase-like protein